AEYRRERTPIIGDPCGRNQLVGASLPPSVAARCLRGWACRLAFDSGPTRFLSLQAVLRALVPLRLRLSRVFLARLVGSRGSLLRDGLAHRLRHDGAGRYSNGPEMV